MFNAAIVGAAYSRLPGSVMCISTVEGPCLIVTPGPRPHSVAPTVLGHWRKYAVAVGSTEITEASTVCWSKSGRMSWTMLVCASAEPTKADAIVSTS